MKIGASQLAAQACISIDVERRLGSTTVDGIESDLAPILDLLRDICKATFFVTGEVAETKPDSVHNISREGHEVACHGLHHERFDTLQPSEQFRRIQDATENILKASGHKPIGFRAPQHRANATTLRVLEDLEYLYDSSVLPRTPFMAPETRKKWRFLFAPGSPYFPSRTNIARRGDSPIVEVPCSTFILPFVSGLSLRSGTASTVVASLLVHRAKVIGGPIVYYLHSYDSTRDGGKLTWLRRVIATLQKQNVEFRTMRQLALTYKSSRLR